MFIFDVPTMKDTRVRDAPRVESTWPAGRQPNAESPRTADRRAGARRTRRQGVSRQVVGLQGDGALG